MKRILITLIFIMLTSIFTGCTVSESNLNQNLIGTNENTSEEMPTTKETDEENSEQTTDDAPTILTHDDFSLDINNSIISLRDENVELQNILGEPISENIEVLPNEADTLKGTFIKTVKYDGLEIILSSPKDDGKNFSILEMTVSEKNYKTSMGIGIGDKVEDIKNAYPNLEIALDGRTDPNNCAYTINYEQLKYLRFEVKEGLVSEINVRYVFQ